MATSAGVCPLPVPPQLSPAEQRPARNSVSPNPARSCCSSTCKDSKVIPHSTYSESCDKARWKRIFKKNAYVCITESLYCTVEIHTDLSPIKSNLKNKMLTQKKEKKRKLTQRCKPTTCSVLSQSCPALCDPTDCSPPGSSVHEIQQARVLAWVAVPFSVNQL